MPKPTSPSEALVSFEFSDAGLSVTIKTKRLKIRSVISDDYGEYVALFSDPMTVAKYMSGRTISDPQRFTNYFNAFITAWKSESPFSGFSVFIRETNDFIGSVTVGQADGVAHAAELSYIFDHNYWNRGYGTEAISTVVNCLVPHIIKGQYLLPSGDSLSSLIATARIDNEASWKILDNLGFLRAERIEEKFGSSRFMYALDTNILMERYKKHVIHLYAPSSPSVVSSSETSWPLTWAGTSSDKSANGAPARSDQEPVSVGATGWVTSSHS